MYRVKRAILMAAGLGLRMRPLTLTIPKPLVPVGGVPMIETAITGLRHQGIHEIYVVVGYLKELFAPLERAYPGLHLIENPYYRTCGNISSLYVARSHLEDAIILDGDQVIYDDTVLRPEFERSGYNCVRTDGSTGEWLLTVEDGIITSCSRSGGSGGYILYSISRWNAEDGRRLRAHLELEFEQKQNRQLYWDDVPLFCHPEKYSLGIREMPPDAVREIDSLRELAELDPSYRSDWEGGMDR